MAFRLLLLLAVALWLPPPAQADDRLTSIRVTETATLPQMRPDWPVPAEPNQFFYIQRSVNRNTVVYALRYGSGGEIAARNPVHVYWRRYATTGARKDLKFVEKQFVYGVNTRRVGGPGRYRVSLKPLSSMPIEILQTGPGRAEIRADIGGRLVRPIYAFVDLDEGGLAPRVTRLSIFGQDVETGRYIGEIFAVRDGVIKQ